MLCIVLLFQYGTDEFPHIVGSYNRCLHDEVVERVITLTECEEGFDESMKSFSVQEAVTCKCKQLVIFALV